VVSIYSNDQDRQAEASMKPFSPAAVATGGASSADATAISVSLDRAAPGVAYRIVELRSPASAPDCARRLEELGFMPGERVVVTARAWPGGDPLAVRVGVSRFALRGNEAACIRVVRSGEAPA
jgi:ferrous iron transport protein A